jgi:hypothetical protein
MKIAIGLIIGTTGTEKIDPSSNFGASKQQLLTTIVDKQIQRLTDCAQLLQLKISQSGQFAGQNFKGILLCPEYYFSCNVSVDGLKEVPHLAFEEEAFFNQTKERLKGLSSQFPGMLIIPGTFVRIITVRNNTNDDQQSRQNVRIAAQLQNRYAIGQTPGLGPNKTYNSIEAAKEKYEQKMKAHVSAINREIQKPQIKVLRNSALCFFNGEVVHTYHKHGNWKEAAGHDATFVPGSKSPVFEIEQVRIGLEICRDHAAGVMLSSVTGQIRDGVLASEFIGSIKELNKKFAEDNSGNIIDQNKSKLQPLLSANDKTSNEKAMEIFHKKLMQEQIKHHLALVDAQSARMGIRLARPDIHIICSDAIDNVNAMMTHENGLFIHASTAEECCKIKVGAKTQKPNKDTQNNFWSAELEFIPKSDRASLNNYQDLKNQLIGVCTNYLKTWDRFIFKNRSATSKTLARYIVAHIQSMDNVQFMKFCRFLDGTQQTYRDPANGINDYMSVREGGELMSRLRAVLANKEI